MSDSQRMKFTCADLATVVTGKLFVEAERLYPIYNFLTGDNLFTHQLPRAFRFCEEAVAGQFPEQTKAMRAAAGFISGKTYQNFLAIWRKEYGDEFDVSSLDGWLHVDAVAELETMVPKEKIIVMDGESDV